MLFHFPHGIFVTVASTSQVFVGPRPTYTAHIQSLTLKRLLLRFFVEDVLTLQTGKPYGLLSSVAAYTPPVAGFHSELQKP